MLWNILKHRLENEAGNSTDSITNVAHLLRVRRTDLPSLRADQWQYYKR
jgi:hypothetical protein